MLDLDTLLAPLPGPLPCGEDMLFSTAFDAIQKAREHDDPSLEQGDWVIDLKEADWPFVISECQKLLRESTKDLRLAVWLTDALASRSGARRVAGLGQGYRLLAGLCDRHWDGLHPLAEDGDLDMRVGSVNWLAVRSIELLQRAPIVDDGHTQYSSLAWDAALSIDQAIRRSPDRAAELTRDKVTTEAFDRVRRATPARFFIALHADLRDCEEAVSSFEGIFDARTAAQGPSFGAVKDLLASMRGTIERFAREAGEPIEPSVVEAVEAVPTEQQERKEPVFDMPQHAAQPTASKTPRDGIQDRMDAIARLKEVATFFERTEPSSPTAYMARKAALWADMPLHAWLRHVIKSEQELALLEDLLGAPKQAQDPGAH